MEAEVTVPTRKELRRRKMIEYLAAKGKGRVSNVKSLPGGGLQKPLTCEQQITKGKENNAPPSVSRSESKKVIAPLLRRPAGKVLSVRDIIKSSDMSQQQEIRKSSALSDSTKVSHKPTLTRTSAAPFKSNVTRDDNQRKELNVRVPILRKTVSCVIVAPKDSHKRPTIPPANTFNARIIHGPIVKTRTGLTPAVIIPQNRRTIPTGAVSRDKLTVTSKLQPVAGSTVSMSKSSSTAQGLARKNPVSKKTTGALPSNSAARHQGPIRPVWQKPSHESRQLNKSKSTFTSSQSRLASAKVNSKAAGQPTEGIRKPRPDTVGQRNLQCKSASSRPGSLPAGRPASRVTVNPAVTQQRGKPRPRIDTESKKPLVSINARQLAAVDRKSALAMTRMVREPSTVIKTIANPAAQAVPPTVAKKMTAVQTERKKKLQEWREARGISYKRPSMHVQPRVRRSVAAPEPFWPAMKEVEEVHSVISAVDRSLADCVTLLKEGCSPDRVKEIINRLPAVSRNFTKFWICQALLMELEGNLDVLPMFEEAVGAVLEPVDELRTVVFEILKKKDKTQEAEQGGQCQTPESSSDPMVTPRKAVGALIYGEKGNSSVVKYKITATPGWCPTSQRKDSAPVNGQEFRFFTPVRRSVRIKRASVQYPASLQDHDLCVSSFNDLMAEEERMQEKSSSPDHQDRLYVYRENPALEDKVTVQLVREEASQSLDEPASC